MPDGRLQHIIEEYKEEMFGCGQQNGVSGVVGSSPLVSCGAIPLADIELRYEAFKLRFKYFLLFLYLKRRQLLSFAATSKHVGKLGNF